MENNANISEEQLTLMNQTITELQAVSETPDSEFSPALVSFSFSGGPAGSQIQGWITYKDVNKRVYCSGEGRMIFGSPVAHGVAVPVAYILPAHVLTSARHCTYEASGSTAGGVLILKADGRIISRFVLPSGGWGLGDWKIEGTCKFEEK